MLPRLRTADAATDLVELGAAEHIGAPDHHGVGSGNVEATFDNGCGEQPVELAVEEARGRVFMARGLLAGGRRRSGHLR